MLTFRLIETFCYKAPSTCDILCSFGVPAWFASSFFGGSDPRQWHLRASCSLSQGQFEGGAVLSPKQQAWHGMDNFNFVSNIWESSWGSRTWERHGAGVLSGSGGICLLWLWSRKDRKGGQWLSCGDGCLHVLQLAPKRGVKKCNPPQFESTIKNCHLIPFKPWHSLGP